MNTRCAKCGYEREEHYAGLGRCSAFLATAPGVVCPCSRWRLEDDGLTDRQLPIRFKSGLRPVAVRAGERAAVMRDREKRRKACPKCGCTPERPCIFHTDAGDEARCMPAGAMGLATCSRCAS